MTQEQKDLMFKDLCARLPYGVKGCFRDSNDELLRSVTITYGNLKPNGMVMTGDIKPYFFPLSSMTEKQRNEYHNLCSIGTDECGDIVYFNTYESIDYLNKNYFDYRGFIPKGWAKDATGLNIYEL